MELDALLTWVISGGGAAVLASWVIDQGGKLDIAKWPSILHWLARLLVWVYGLAFEAKRIAAFALTSGLAMAAYSVGAGFGYVACPIGLKGWVENLVLIATSAFALGQLIHGRKTTVNAKKAATQ